MTAGLVETRSLSEQWGRRFDDRCQTRVLFATWLLPAAGLMASGALGLGLIDAPVDEAKLLAKTQAVTLVLAIVTLLMVVRCAVARLPWSGLRSSGAGLGRVGAISLGVAVVTAIAATQPGLQAVAVPAAAGSGCFSGLCGSLWLYRLPQVDPGPLAGLVAVVSGLLSVGWLPVLEPTLVSSPVPLLFGMLLAVAAIRAASVPPFALLDPASRPTIHLDPVSEVADGSTMDLSLEAVGPAAVSLG